MKLKYCLTVVLAAVVAGCEDYTDIQPKGTNLLTTVSQLDMLLNQEYDDEGLNGMDEEILVGDMLPSTTNIPNLLSAATPTMSQILLTCDEATDRLTYLNTDYKYNAYYKIIGSVANPVIQKVDNAKGDTAKGRQLKAESLTLRAWFHYLAVNHFAKAYDPATAATDGGICYVHENDLRTVPEPKLTVQAVYDNILADIDAAIALDALPDVADSKMRVNKAFAYAVKAMAEMSMCHYDDALMAAQSSLASCDTIVDYNQVVSAKGYWTRPLVQWPEDLFTTAYSSIYLQTSTADLDGTYDSGSIIYSRARRSTGIGRAIYGIGGIKPWLDSNCYFNGSGLTTIDMYLTVAECRLRSGDINGCMHILDKIRAKRYMAGRARTLEGATTTKAEAIDELRKIVRQEGFGSCRTYLTLKRWNADSDFRADIVKNINGNSYKLGAGSKLWIFPFPLTATGLNKNLTQNYED